MPKSRRRKKLSKAEAGRIGGRTTRKRHGIEHYRQAGKKGFMVTVARHWAGDKWSYIRYLHECGWLTEVSRLFEARPYGPDGIKSIEIPDLARRARSGGSGRPAHRADPGVDPVGTRPRRRRALTMARPRLSPEERTERRREAALKGVRTKASKARIDEFLNDVAESVTYQARPAKGGRSSSVPSRSAGKATSITRCTSTDGHGSPRRWTPRSIARLSAFLDGFIRPDGTPQPVPHRRRKKR